MFAGGMDAYVREFGQNKLHDEFYTNNTIISIFQNYTTNVITRYINSPAIFSWEIANDPRYVVSGRLPNVLLTQCVVGATLP
jgi:mannan endo-1,4-beta-mannosidase